MKKSIFLSALVCALFGMLVGCSNPSVDGGIDCSNDSTSRTLGVGLKHDRNGLAWCTSSANAYSTNITTIQCPDAGSFTFTGDKNGSDNLAQIAAFLGDDDDTGTAGNYPAFEFAKNYSKTAANLGTYNTDWYLPTIAELFAIWKVKDTVDTASDLCGGSKFGTSWYCSSSQYASINVAAYLLDFLNGDWDSGSKDASYYYVCCIRAFN